MTIIMHEELNEKVYYDPKTGKFFYKKDGRNKVAGEECGTIIYRGASENIPYIKITIDGESYLAHRLAFFLMTKSWPINQIDHIDGNGLNNKWENLREATHTQNMQNRKGSSKHGLPKGVFPNGKSGFMARIVVNKKKIYLGTFKTPEEAKSAYNKASIEHFGSFARL